MIAFGCAIEEPEPYRRYAEPGIRAAQEADSAIFPFAGAGTTGRSLNLLLKAASAHEDLEALVLVHPHAEITDPELCQKIRTTLQDDRVAVIGVAGARDARSLAWWEGAVTVGQVTQRYTEHGGGDLPGFSWVPANPAPAEVDVVDGFLMVLSPWAVRELRFDEGLVHGYGYDVDFCRSARSAGRKVVAADLRVTEHRPLKLVGQLPVWVEGHIQLARKWEGRTPGVEPSAESWQQRARRAEAEREAARAIAYSRQLAIDAQVEQLERELGQTTDTASWRLTKPLRELNRWRHERVRRRGGGVGLPPAA